MRKRHKAAVVLAAAIIAWFLVPELKTFLGAALGTLFKLLLIAGLIAVVWLLAPLVFWDAPRFFFRRFVTPYVRLRRMVHHRNAKLLQEAAARPDSRNR